MASGDISGCFARDGSGSLPRVRQSQDVASDLASICPELAADWAANATDLDLPYVALGHLASRLMAVDRAHPGADFAPLFQGVERLMVDGNPALRNLLIVGFLEGIQNSAPTSVGKWEPLLGPSTRKAWSALNDLWLGRITASAFNEVVDG